MSRLQYPFVRRAWLLLWPVLLLLGSPATAQSPTLSSHKVDQAVIQQLKEADSAEFIIVLAEQADLSGAEQLHDKATKGQYVYDTLRAFADNSQSAIRAQLDAQGITYQAFYISNKIYVPDGNETLVNSLAARNDVAAISANERYQLDEPIRDGKYPATPTAIEPNLTFVNADDVWAMGITGDGVVLAGNDTGLDWDHPALINQYRGWNGASADHNHNWWDATGTYPTIPGDGHGHGTHTTGTMVGDDGGDNQTGIAPGARTIHCKNLDDGGFGSDADIIECFQWDLAPWDLNGNNPRPDLAPDVINNSWGGYGGNPVFQPEIIALQAAGILVEFSAGNNGSGCYSLGSPGDFPDVLTTGSIGHTGGILPGEVTWFSSRGPSAFTEEPLPDIMAPGEDIRSSLPGGQYEAWSGTSMSGPHVSGLVGLIWSANPGLRGLITETNDLIKQTAVPLSGQLGSQCGGDYEEGPNNDWGHGTIDALAAVNAAMLFGDPGTLTGTVANSSNNMPLAGATVTAQLSPDLKWKRVANDTGVYSMIIFSGNYTVTGSLYGYYPKTLSNVEVIAENTTVLDIALDPAPFYTVSGVVTNAQTGWPLYARISIAGYPGAPVWSDPLTGAYAIDLAAGVEYVFTVVPWVSGYQPGIELVTPLTGATTLDFALSADSYACEAPGYQPDLVYYEDFESDAGGLTVDGLNPSWEWGVPTSGPRSAHSGRNAWATNLSGNYNDNEISSISTGDIDLSAYTGDTIIASWWEWLYTEPCCDTVSMDVSNDGGASWSNYYWNTSDQPGGWNKQTVILDPSYAVTNFRMRFNLQTDFSVTYPGYYIDDLGIGIANVPSPFYVEDFEVNNGSYAVAGVNTSWEWGEPTRGPGAAHSGLNAWATDLDSNYNNNETSTLTSPAIDLTASGDGLIAVSWWQWLQTEAGYDTLAVEASTDSGANWQPIFGPLSGPIDLAWTPYTVVLDASYAVSDFRLRFALTTDSSVTYPGATIDDIVIAPYSDALPSVACHAQAGGLVVGTVRDANTGFGLNGATVRSESDTTTSNRAADDGFYVLFAEMGGQVVSAEKSGYAPDSANLTIANGSVQAHDFSLATGILSADPTAIDVTLAMGGQTTVPLVVTNNGGLSTDFTIGERNGAFTPANRNVSGTGTWLSQAESGVLLRTNQSAETLAFPASYRWQPSAPTANLNILLYSDDPYHAAPQTYPDQALQQLSLPYIAHYDGDYAGFMANLNSGVVWDIVIYANDNYIAPDSLLNVLNNYVLSGGHLIFHSWTVGFAPGAALYANLGLSWAGDIYDPPAPVYWWKPENPVFTTPQEVPQFTAPTNFRYSIYGQRVEPLEGVTALAGYTTSELETGQAALLIGNEGRTVFRGFLDGQNDADLDTDGLPDGVELWINLLDGIQVEFSPDVTWLSADILSGTIGANAEQTITIAIDASVPEVAQPGAYQAALRFSNDTPYGALNVPVTLNVLPPAGWGKLDGVVTGLLHCDASGVPLRNATVSIDGVVDLTTRGDGLYAYWMPAGDYDVTITRNGYASQQFAVTIAAGSTTQHDIDLRRLEPCGAATPAEIVATMPQFAESSVEVTLSNLGAGEWSYQALETPLLLTPTALRSAESINRSTTFTPGTTGPTSMREQLHLNGTATRTPTSGWFGGAENPGGAVRYGAAQCAEEPNAFYVVSGVDRFYGLTNAVWRYDAATNNWTSLLPIPTAQEGTSAVCYQGRLYALGGGGSNQFYIFDLATREWLVGAPLPRGTEGAAVAVWNGRIYLVGGDDDFYPGSGVSAEVNIYDIVSDTWLTNGSPMPIPASHAGSIQLGSTLYIVGGWGELSPDENLTATQRYDLLTDSWEMGPEFTSARADFALAGTNQALYAIGGDADGNFFFEPTKQVDRLALADWTSSVWRDIGDPLPVPLTSTNAGFCTRAVFNPDIAEIWSVGGIDGYSVGGRTLFRELLDETCYSIFADVPWLSLTPVSGVVSADTNTTLNVTLNSATLLSGEHHATLVITSNDAQIQIPIMVTVTPVHRLLLPVFFH